MQKETYFIHESNMPRLEKRLAAIRNKCVKYGVYFDYKQIGEEFREVINPDTGKSQMARFIEVEATGLVRHNNWTFVAVIEHMNGHGRNVVRQFNPDHDIPSRYYIAVPRCEHCNTSRVRKQTYLLHNGLTNEWKQVGGSCLKEFTQGLDAEAVAAYISLFDNMIQGESVQPSTRMPKYFDTNVVLRIAYEVVRAFGYRNTEDFQPTRDDVVRLYDYLQGYKMGDKIVEDIKDQIEKGHIDPDSRDAVEFVKNFRQWLSKEDTTFGYMMNLKAVADTEYVQAKHLGILVSAVPTYNRAMKALAEKQAREAKAAEEAAKSRYIGTTGEKFTRHIVDGKCVASWDSVYGTTFLYKFISDSGEVIMWSTSNYVDADKVVELTGKVKKHEEYRGVKQTVAYYCKVTIQEEEPDMEEIRRQQEANRQAMLEIREAMEMIDNWDEED